MGSPDAIRGAQGIGRVVLTFTRADATAALAAVRARLAAGSDSPSGRHAAKCLSAVLAGKHQPADDELVTVRLSSAVWDELYGIVGVSDHPCLLDRRSKSGAMRLTPDELACLADDLDRGNERPCRTAYLKVRDYLNSGEWRRKPKPKPMDDIKAEAEAVINETVKECIAALLANEGYVLPKGWTPEVKISWAAYRRGCNADDKGIWLAPLRWLDGTEGPKRYGEYKAIAKAPVIGSAWFADWRGVIRCVTAHEVAHVVQCGICNCNIKGPMDRTDCCKPHGVGWREIYRELRTAVVNMHVVAAPADDEAEAA